MGKKRKRLDEATQTFSTGSSVSSSFEYNYSNIYLYLTIFLRKSYGVHSKKYSVGCESSARAIQSGTGHATTCRNFWPDTATAQYSSLCPGDECGER